MDINQARILIAGSESEASILAIFAPGAMVATTPQEVFAAIDDQPHGFDIIVSSTTFSNGLKASDLIDYADEVAERIPSVLLFSANSDELTAQQRAIPQAETFLLPSTPSDFKGKLQEIVQKRT